MEGTRVSLRRKHLYSVTKMIRVVCYSSENRLNSSISLPDTWQLQLPMEEGLESLLPEDSCNLQLLPVVCWPDTTTEFLPQFP